MKKSIKTLWLKALRSKKYKQGRGALHRVTTDGGDEFCCLGVLCDLYSKDQDISWTKVEYSNTRKIGSSSNYLPPKVRKWAGLPDKSTSQDPCVRVDIRNSKCSGRSRISALNDTKGFSFKKLANRIEKDL